MLTMLYFSQNSGSVFFQWIIETVKYYLPNISDDTIFSVLVSIGIFSLGWFITWYAEKRKERKRLKERANFLTGSINERLKAVESQAEKFEELSEDLKDISKRNYVFNKVTGLSLAFYAQNIVEDIHKVLERHESKSFKIVKELSGAINGINSQLEHAKINFNNFSTNAYRNETSWADATDKIFRFYDELLGKVEEEEDKNDDFFKEFDRILLEWVQIRDDRNTTKTYENLIAPLRKLSFDSLPHKEARKVLPYLHQAVYAYENLIDNRDRYAKIFAKDAKQIRDYGSKLSLVTDIIDENLKWHRKLSKHFNKQDSIVAKLVDPQSKKDK